MAIARSACIVALCAAGFAASLAAPVHARLITFAFEGVVTSISGEPHDYFPAADDGVPVSGTYTFESTTPDTNPDPNRGQYDHAVKQIVFRVGPDALVIGPPFNAGISVANQPFGPIDDEEYSVFATTDIGGSFSIFEIQLFNVDSDGALTSDALPLTPPDISKFDFRRILLNVGASDFAPGEAPSFVIDAALTSLTLVPAEVPEPAMPALVGLGLLLINARRRRAVSKR